MWQRKLLYRYVEFGKFEQAKKYRDILLENELYKPDSVFMHCDSIFKSKYRMYEEKIFE